MRFPCRVEKRSDGRWLASSEGSPAGDVEVTAADREDALAKLQREIRYRIELCPCTGVSDTYVELEIK